MSDKITRFGSQLENIRSQKNLKIIDISLSEWETLLNERDQNNIAFLSSIMKENSTGSDPIRLAGLNFNTQTLSKRLSELNDPVDLQSEHKLFWQKLHDALSSKKPSLQKINKLIETAPDSLMPKLAPIKQRLLEYYEYKKGVKKKKKELLNANTEQIIQQIIALRDEETLNYQKSQEKIKSSQTPLYLFPPHYEHFNEHFEAFEELSKKSKKGYEARKKMFIIGLKLNEDLMMFQKNPYMFVDPMRKLSSEQRKLKVLQVFSQFKEFQEDSRRDQEDYALEKNQQLQETLQQQIKAFESIPEQHVLVDDLKKQMTLLTEENAYLSVQKAVRHDLEHYILAYNQPTLRKEISLPIAIDEDNKQSVKEALSQFCQINENGLFVRSAFFDLTEYRTVHEFSGATLQFIERIKNELPIIQPSRIPQELRDLRDILKEKTSDKQNSDFTTREAMKMPKKT